MRRRMAFVLGLALFSPCALGQWDPNNGQWRKSDPTHVRVMTWNVRDGICSTSDRKKEQHGNWHALVCIVASLRPDVLILQETGDNSGNGTGSGVDSVAALTTTLGLFMYGGADPFVGGQVTSYVQKYAPDFDLPHVFVSSITDGFNRNVILSRFPFADLNGDGKSLYADIAFKQADGCSNAGTGGIRGFQHAEIDLPDGVYAGDLVIGNSHLKSGSTQNDVEDRAVAADKAAYYIYYWYAGAGTGTPDPNNKISDSPPATSVLSSNTPVIWGGDWNEDETKNGAYRGPAARMVQGCSAGGSDGTDRDTTDATYDDAAEFFSGNRSTFSTSKLDYIAWWDSVATPARMVIFNSSPIPSGKHPPELLNYPNPVLASGAASDHRPVIVDFILPLAAQDEPRAFVLLSPEDGANDEPLRPTFSWSDSFGATSYSLTIAEDAGLGDVIFSASGIGGTSYLLPAGVLDHSTQYHWGVTAHNSAGDTGSTPFSRSFTTEPVPPPGPFLLQFPGNGATGISRLAILSWNTSSNAETYTVRVATDPAMTNLIVSAAGLAETTYQLQPGQLQPCTTYYWGVTAFNGSGDRDSTPYPSAFETHGIADMNGDGTYDTLDFLVFLNFFAGGHPEADLNLDGKVDTLDFLFFLNNWTAGC
ncbi:MAG: hypothetical protein AMXMBFR77_11360 [Phycisphaerales bacterium]|nr:hypothetical protein [Leptolyngbya sp.]MCZ7633174.1 hypothetical protein [Phycisphaerales bacterium]MDL1905391.1 hypothetical protein [Synechococcales cyanobacterium CNB]GIK18348.1 MAG: hypothetical protein BroJett004_05120 [Planctomycetota bacterium]